MKYSIIASLLLFIMPTLSAHNNASHYLDNPSIIKVAPGEQSGNEVNNGKKAETDNTQVKKAPVSEDPPGSGNEDDGEGNSSHFTDLQFLIFALTIIVIITEAYLIKVTKFNWSPYSIIRLMGLTLILFTALFLSVGKDLEGKTLNQVFGLLGAIAGYLLGKDAKEKDVTKGEAQNPPVKPATDDKALDTLPEPKSFGRIPKKSSR